MSRYRNIVDGLIRGVRSIVPESSPDMTFMCAEDSRGGVQSPGDWMMNPMRRTREFDIRSSDFTYPGPGCNVLTAASIRVAYRLDTDLGDLDVVIQEDIRSIIDTVMFSTLWWGAYANSVYVEDGDQPEAEFINDGSDRPATLVVKIPIVIDYRRSE